MSVLCSVIEVLFSFFVFVNFSNVHVVLHHRSAVQFLFFLHLSILLMFMSVLCSVMFSFFVFFNFSNVHVCFVLRHRSAVQFFSFFLHLSILVMFMSALCPVMFDFLYFSILLMFFKCSLCILICECICLFLSSSVASLFFATL